ncbi:30S ribosomal protein S12 methylthiotransferase RimO [Caldichromatium japonicum]|uniref:Ribosomal protein uS12 methylthiotransferase RimO n=1 Tax=Caldichromatium japonicum TaxID=2699430 RepID=A0A6G7VD34_9GAMM|nr:30S ribosomal protein S12 methylthiotransferase RimO [Caldichromatium japonicum]QIK37786.1 30S ribosomal protein S12 methylthiotransferase RimO [Caldichromatium japonicum]
MAGLTLHHPAPTEQPSKIAFISLGCPKATVDSELILSRLRAEGYSLQSDLDQADLVIVNTCGFIEPAVDESLAVIGEALEENGRVIVTGCLGTRAELIRTHYPEVLAITGPRDLEAVMAAVHERLPPLQSALCNLIPQRSLRLTPRHYAYLKIAEGCDHRCSFCIIPGLRGPLVSRPIGEVLAEACQLVESGVREILVIAQDTAAYGQDLKYRPDFWATQPLRTHVLDLAQALGELPAWIRLHYVYPYPQLDKLVELMAEGLILPYLDMPLQHASLKILRAMRRPAATERILERLEKWRALCPELVVRSTFIVGFPGETDDDFGMLLDFLRAAQIDRVGCFTYSPIVGAAANDLPASVPEPVKQERLERLMTLQAEISRSKLAGRLGQRLTVLVDRVEEDAVIARSYGDAPEIDGQVIIEGAWEIAPGDFMEVEVIDTDAHDLWARPLAVDA